MKIKIQTSRAMMLMAGVATLGSTFLTATPAHADKSKNLKIGAAILGVIAAVKLSKGDTVVGAAAGAGAYYAYKKSKDAKNDERYGYDYDNSGNYDNNRYPDSGYYDNSRNTGYNDSYDASYDPGYDSSYDTGYYGNDGRSSRRNDSGRYSRNDRGGVNRYPDSSYLVSQSASQGDSCQKR